MKKKIGIAIALILAGYMLHAQTTPRFERLLQEKHDRYVIFEVYHDRESGQEFTCEFSGVDMGYAVSCFPTGRNWK